MGQIDGEVLNGGPLSVWLGLLRLRLSHCRWVLLLLVLLRRQYFEVSAKRDGRFKRDTV